MWDLSFHNSSLHPSIVSDGEVRLAHEVIDCPQEHILVSFDGNIVAGTGEQRTNRTTNWNGRTCDVFEWDDGKVDALTIDGVKAAANDVINNDQDRALAAVGGIHELPDYNWIRRHRHSYMLRFNEMLERGWGGSMGGKVSL